MDTDRLLLKSICDRTRDRDRVSRQLKRRLKRLGYQVSLEPTEPQTPTSSVA